MKTFKQYLQETEFVSESISRSKPNPYTPGTWEYKNYELGIAGQGVRNSKVAQKIAKDELEPDEFFSAKEKATESSSQLSEATGFDPDDEQAINRWIAEFLTDEFGGKAWFKGGSYAYLFDVNNPTVITASDGAKLSTDSWAKCIGGWADKYAADDLFDAFYDGYPLDNEFFRPVKNNIPMAKDGAPAYGGEQERHELAMMRGESVEDIKKLAGL